MQQQSVKSRTSLEQIKITNKNENLLENITQAHNDKQFLNVINHFEENYLKQNQSLSSKAKISQTYLHLYAKSLLNLVIEIFDQLL